jgi:DNA-binding MarR family transcriptional regulator
VTPSGEGWSDDAREIWKLLLQPAFQMLGEHIRGHVIEHRLSPSQACMLQELNEPMSQREVASRLGHDPSNITALADALEARGLIERRLDPADRRIRTLARTAEGEELTRHLNESLSSPPPEINRLSPEEQVVLLRLLRRVFSEQLDFKDVARDRRRS